MELTGAQGSAVMKALDSGGRRFNRVAAGEGSGFLVEESSHFGATTTVIIEIFRHGNVCFGSRGDLMFFGGRSGRGT